MFDTSPSSQPVAKTGLQVLHSQVPTSAGTSRWTCGKASQTARKVGISGGLVGNYPYW